MALSQSVTDSLQEAEQSLRNALAFAARGERSICLLYTSPSPRDKRQSRMPSSA